MPSRTISGSLLALRERVPRMRIEPPSIRIPAMPVNAVVML